MNTGSAVLPEYVESQMDESTTEYTVPAANGSRKTGYLVVKRLFDMVAAFCAGVILLIPMLIIAVIIRLDSKGPALFRQERLGKEGKQFMMVKFRSMHLNAEADGPRWAAAEDERCTRVGHVLRKARLDELPQLWNILVGHMSFVGPRPERAYFYDQFETYIHGFRNRLAVRPGLTGLAQVNGGYDLRPEEKIIYDMEYIEKQSFWLDLKCLFKTVKLVFTHEGAR